MNLQKKILLGYGAVLVLLALVFAWAFVNLFRLGQASEAILSENYRSILAAENMTGALERQDSAVLLYVLGAPEEGIRQFRTNQVAFLEWLGRARDNITIEGEEAVLADVDSAYTAYLIRFTELLDAEALNLQTYRERMLPAFLPVRAAGARLRDLNQQTMFAASDRAAALSDRARWSMATVGLLALGLGLGLSLYGSRRLVRPIRQMREATRHVAEGNYDVEVPATRTDELGDLARQFNEMAAELRAFRDLNVGRIVAEKRKSDAIIQSIDDGLLVIDAGLGIEKVNPAAAAALGLDVQQAQGRHFLETVRDERLFAYLKETLESGQAPAIEEAQTFLTMEHGGTPEHYQFAVTPVYSPARELLGAILLLRDVTKLKELDRLKSEFVATASHELRTPLTSIGMSIGLLQERAAEKLGEREQALLSAAAEDVERLRRLVSDLLDLSKIEAGKIELAFAATPVALLLEKTVQALRAQAEDRSIRLTTEVPDDLPDVCADADKITWVLTNLVANALRHTDAGGSVRLSAGQAGSHVHLAVADDGEGIPYAYQAKIFDKFVQVGGEKSVGGSGLGLAICKEIVRAHGGSIWVDSAPGAGSTFTFTLPLATAA